MNEKRLHWGSFLIEFTTNNELLIAKSATIRENNIYSSFNNNFVS